MTKVSWKHSAAGSVLYAAAAVAQNLPLNDPRLNRLLVPAVDDINTQLGASDLDWRDFWQAMVKGGFQSRDDLELCENALQAAGCSSLTVDTMAKAISGAITDLRLLFGERFPKLAEQLPLRSGPLRTAWEAYGPGLLRQIAKLTHDELLPQRVTVWFVQPVAAGGGDADAKSKTVWMEAMLTNVDTQVPEVLRLAWLIARVGLGHENANRFVDPGRLPAVASTALVPIVLAAGRELDLLPTEAWPVPQATQLWLRNTAAKRSDIIQSWWRQLSSGETPFPVAIKALDRMLQSE